jgi:uncharacterized protein DUF6636
MKNIPNRKPLAAVLLPLVAAGPLAAAAIAFPATAGATTNFNFHSPSGNIFCDMRLGDDGKSQATCITTERNWVAPPRSADCSPDQRWGDALSLYQGTAGFQCYTRLPDDSTAGQVLHYGDTLANGSITCESEPDGMTCTDVATGHFFRIARESYQLS